MLVLGVDPGSAICGYGLVAGTPGAMRYVAAGTIRCASLAAGPKRLLRIHENLLSIIEQYAPTVLSIERHFVAINVQSAFRLGEARAMAMLAAAERGLEMFEYPPTEVKLAIAGHGHADKAQVKYMVRRTLKLDPSVELADDAADALAVAMCHVGHGRMPNLVEAVERSRSSVLKAPRVRLEPN